MIRAAALVLVSFLVACGSKGPDTPPSQAPSTPTSTAPSPPAAEAPPAAAAEAAPPKRARKPFEVHSSCAEVVTVAFVEDPKAAPASYRKPIAPSSSVEGPRNDDGNQTVWLFDEKGEPIAKVNVTRGMKRVEIGRSCRTLDAR